MNHLQNDFHVADGKESDWKQPLVIYQGESCLINLTAFYEEVTGSGNLVRSMDIVYLDLTKSLAWSDIVSLHPGLTSLDWINRQQGEWETGGSVRLKGQLRTPQTISGGQL